MIVPNQKVKVKWHPMNIQYYESLGYTYTKLGDEIELDIKYLPLNSNSEVDIICDFCGKHHFNQFRRKSKSKNQFCSKECQDSCLIGKESTNKLAINEVNKIITKKTDGKCRLINFIETHVNMEIECQCGEHFLVLLSNFKKGKIYCNNCMDNIRKQKQFNKIALYIYDCGNVIISNCEDYVDCDSLLKIKCNCGEVFRTTFRRYKHRGKRQCDNCGFIQQLESQKHNIEVVYSLFKNKGLIPMFSEEEYKNSKSRLGFKCSKHIDEETQYTSYNSLSRGFGIGCTHCRNEKLREEFKIKNPRDFFIEKGFIPLFENEEYINSNHDLPFICKAHQEYGVQETNIKNVRYNKGCKYCSDSKSKGEIRIREFLDQFNSIQYKLQESFSDCKYRIPLKFDFLVFSSEILQLVIEYDGLQHFEPVDFAGKGEEWALKQFKETQKRDEIKDKYCEKNNIPILRIPYWDFDNIENILENTLMKYII